MATGTPTPKTSLAQAKTTYISWNSFDFQLIGNNTFRPALTAANETEVVTNVKTYKSYTPKDSIEPMTIRVLYDPTTWTALRSAKEAGTTATLETSDGFSATALITEMAEVTADIDGPITDMTVTFAFPPSGTTSTEVSGSTT